MPISISVALHPDGNLSHAERQALADGLAVTLGDEGGADEDDD